MLVTAFQMAQIAAAVLIGNVLTRVLFQGWERMKNRQKGDALFYLAPLAFIVLVVLGSTSQ